jgi:serine/threonine-protein kinase
MAHPTIVRVYDAGEEITRDEFGTEHKYPFIVMEYVKGQLLRDLLHERRLSKTEAINFATGVLTALEFSHRAGIVHRDIKSANIMITETGQVKVMDFGIARAISDSSATQAHTSGIVGTAQYFSPEQARGEAVDARTDLYSTGVLLYEMLCGRPPFKGESAVSVAYQHVSEAVIAPSQFDSTITPEIDAVVLRALAKDREERFQSAEEFREHLLAAVNGSPAPVAAPAAPVTEVVAEVPTLIAEVAEDDFEALLGDLGRTTVIPKVEAPKVSEPAWNDIKTPATNPFSTLGVELPTNTGNSPAPLLSGVGKPSTGLMWTIGSAVSVVLVGLMVWFVAFGNFNFNVTPGGGIAVANVVNQTYADGYKVLTDQGLLVSKVAEPSETVPADTILRTDPTAGTAVPEKTVITVYVSSGAGSVMVPSLLGLTEAEAAGVLATFKLTLGTITETNSASIAAGKVVETVPALNTSVAEGTAINLLVSNGKVMVPDVRNLSISDARSAMSAPDVALPVSITTQGTCEGTQGTTVIEQSIAPGLAKQGSAVILYVGCVQ